MYDPPLKYLAVFEVDGTIAVLPNDVEDDIANAVTFTIPTVANGAGCPFILPGLFRKVYATGTDISDAAMIGYR